MKNLFLSLVFALVTSVATANPGEYGYALGKDTHDTVTILFTKDMVEEYWNDFNLYSDNTLYLHELGFEVHGLEAMYLDKKGNCRTVRASYGHLRTTPLPKNWTVIQYYGSEEVEGHVAFYRDPKTGLIHNYYPDEAKF